MRAVRFWAMVTFVALIAAVTAVTALGVFDTTDIERASEAFGGGDANNDSRLAWVTPDGRYGIFYSLATNIIEGGTTPGRQHVYMRDFVSQTTTLVSQSTAGAEGLGFSFTWDLSDDGRYVVFQSTANNLDPADANFFSDVFVRDMQLGTTTLVSLSTTGQPANAECTNGHITNDGRYVFFATAADNLVPGDSLNSRDLFVRDTVAGTTERLTDTPPYVPAPPWIPDYAGAPSISDDGRYVAFEASYDVTSDGWGDGLFLIDRSLNTTERIDVTIDATTTDAPSFFPMLSGDGRYVTFHSQASNLVEGDTNGTDANGKDCFLRDLQLGTTERVSVPTGGVGESNGESRWTSITDDGRYVAFYSYASNLVPGDTNGFADVFVHDRTTARTEIVSRPTAGGESDGDSESPRISGDGGHVVFHSAATNLASLDTSTWLDVFYADIAWTDGSTAYSGSNRIGTAIDISQAAYPSPSAVTTVVIATGYDWPDGLGGSAYAGAVDGPILLVAENAMPSEVLIEIRRLGASAAVILGGENAVGPAVFAALEAELGVGTVSRIGGADRYETSRMIADETVIALGGTFDGTAFVATGDDFPDALAASPIAAAQGWPIYVVGSTLGTPTASAMTSISVSDAVILGGTGVVPAAVETSLVAQLGGGSVTRLAGATRYETAASIANWGVGNAGLYWDRVALATGDSFPDALTGGVLQARSRSVMMLTHGDELHMAAEARLAANKAVIWEVRFLGGKSAISKTVRTAAKAAIK